MQFLRIPQHSIGVFTVGEAPVMPAGGVVGMEISQTETDPRIVSVRAIFAQYAHLHGEQPHFVSLRVQEARFAQIR